MATTSKYYVLTPTADNLDFLDFDLRYGSITTVGESIQYNGTAKVDSVFVRPGLTYDLSNTSTGVDKIYLTGNLTDYTGSVTGNLLTFSRTVNGKLESVTVFGGTQFNYDDLIFANGIVTTNALYNAVKNSTALPTPDPSETSLAPIGAAAPGATLNAVVKAYSTNGAGVGEVGETFASTKPGISLIVNGGNGIDTVYVADGETVDATILGSSVDLVYFRGNWADYTKSILPGNLLLFTRTINGHFESVTVSAGTSFNYDKLIFADGAVTSDNAKIGINTSTTIPLINVPGVDPTTTTPLYNDDEVQNAINAIRDAAQGNSASDSTPSALTYHIAGVSGVLSSNLASMNSALNSNFVDGNHADTAPKIQAIVTAYSAILTEANGAAANPNPLLDSTPYTNVGVTGVTGTAAAGNALFLLDDVVDNSQTAAVDTVPELQAMADAAARVIAAAGGTAAQAAALTQTDLTNLGVTGVSPSNITAIQAAIQAVGSDSLIDTRAEIQALVNAAATANHAPVLDASKSPSLGSIDTTITPADPVLAVGTLVSALVNTTGIANFSDADPGTTAGMAITGYNTTAGTLYYSINNGTSWTNWTPSSGLALHLLADVGTRLFFKPAANASGDPGITFDAWDHSNGLTNGASAPITTVGGTSAYSSASDIISFGLLAGYTPPPSPQISGPFEPSNSLIANFNGDNFMDLSTGSFPAQNFPAFKQYVRLGSASGISVTPTDAGVQNPTTGPLQGTNSKPTASALDFNGDGYADVTMSDQSAIRAIVFGNSSGNTTTHEVTTTWSGNAANLMFTVARGAGDYNGDGYQDLFTSNAYSYSSDVSTDAAGLVYGNAAGNFAFDSNNANVGVAFSSTSNSFGLAPAYFQNGPAAAYVGDMNRDGLSDIVFADYLTGNVYVKFGTAAKVATQAINASAVGASTGNGLVISGLSTAQVTGSFYWGLTVGTNVASAGDMNGDGYSDLLIMSPGNSAAYVIYGKPTYTSDLNVNTLTPDQGFKISASNINWLFGWNGASVGDVNGDGYGDIVITDPNKTTAGGAVVVFGGATGAHGDISVDSGGANAVWTTQINFTGMTYQPGFAVHGMGNSIGSSAGDVNGDGLSDFSIGGALDQERGLIVYGDTAMSVSLNSLNPLLRGSNVNGTSAAERLIGTSGNDTLSGGGGNDAISAGAGNDTVLIHDASFLHLDGGLGVDTLKLDATASGVNLDFTTNGLGGKIVGFEDIDLTGGGNNSMKLTVQDILAQSNVADTAATSFNEAHLMVVSGNAGDSLTVSSTLSKNPGIWSAGSALSAGDRSALSGLGYQFVGADNYTVYTNGLATLIVDNAVSYSEEGGPPVNHAPVLDASKSPTLGSINTTTAAPTPVGPVGTMVSSLVNTTGISNFSDVDVGTTAGMAITGYNTATGTLYYSTNNGTTWTAWTPSGNQGLHLLADSSTRIYFKPVTNTMGDAAISFEAWDHSNNVANGGIAAITATGGSTAYSSTSDNIGYSLLGSGYAPPPSTFVPGQYESVNSLIANFNGDGFMDLSDGSQYTGQFVRLGTLGGITANTTDSGVTTPTTGPAQYSFNNITASPLDFNGDGYADVTTGSWSPVREIIFGNSAGTTLTSAVGATWTGLAGFRSNIAKGAGDYNGDGYQDLFTTNDNNYAGLVYGNAAGTFAFDSNNASVGVTFGSGAAGFGATFFGSFGINGAGGTYIGDSNGDGLSDIAIGNYLAGAVYVKYGTATQFVNQALDVSTVFADSGRSFGITGLPTTQTSTGSSYVITNVASAGDVNGDGYADLLIMAPATNSAYVIYGKPNGSEVNINVNAMTAAQGFKVSVTNSTWAFGSNGAGIGDVNGDGYSDFAIGEPDKPSGNTNPEAFGYTDGVVVIFGGATGSHGDIVADSSASSGGWATQLDFSGLTSPFYPPYFPSRLGIGIGSTAGDVNGDGLSDFVITGALGTYGPYVIYGNTAMSSLAGNPLLRGSNLTGSTADERLLGTSGNDTLSGGGGADAISAGAGNDTVLIHDAGFLHLDGGLGTDTLKLDATASGVNLDFTANGLGGKILGFEGIDLTGGGNNSLKLTVQDVLHQGNQVNTAVTNFNEAHLMVVSGNAGDTVTMANSISLNPGTWSAGSALSAGDRTALTGLGYQFVGADSYTVYTNGLATLIVDNAVNYQVV